MNDSKFVEYSAWNGRDWLGYFNKISDLPKNTTSYRKFVTLSDKVIIETHPL